MPENPESHSAAGPCGKPGEPEGRANSGSPEQAERMNNQPVNRDRKFKEENKSGNGMEETHSTLLSIVSSRTKNVGANIRSLREQG
jgi:hypothetical protein